MRLIDADVLIGCIKSTGLGTEDQNLLRHLAMIQPTWQGRSTLEARVHKNLMMI